MCTTSTQKLILCSNTIFRAQVKHSDVAWTPICWGYALEILYIHLLVGMTKIVLSSQSRHRLFTRYSLNLAKGCARWSVTALVSVLLSLLLLLLQFSLFPLSIYLSILILLPEAMCVSEWVCASITSLSVITDDTAQIRNTKFGPQLEKHLGWVPYFFLCVCVCVAVVVTFN